MAKRRDDSDAHIDEQGAESFPASDPPAFNAGERIGEPCRQKLRAGEEPARPRPA